MDVNTIITLMFAVGIPAGLAIHYFTNASRSSAVRGFAQSIGWEYLSEDSSLARTQITKCPIFEVGQAGRFLNVIRGKSGGVDVVAFDYRHMIGGALSTFTHDSLLGDALLGIQKNRKPTYYNMTVVAARGVRAASTVHEKVPQMSGGHTYLERAGDWAIVYRFDRRVPISGLRDFIQKSIRTIQLSSQEG